jgi:hypothetical protein
VEGVEQILVVPAYLGHSTLRGSRISQGEVRAERRGEGGGCDEARALARRGSASDGGRFFGSDKGVNRRCEDTGSDHGVTCGRKSVRADDRDNGGRRGHHPVAGGGQVQMAGRVGGRMS